MMLITPEALHARLADVVVLDASLHLPGTGRDATAEFEAAHIPGALRFDIDVIADTTSGLPHTLPSPEAFAAAVGALGIGNDTEVVVYDAEGFYSAPRARWMFRVMGHDAAILDGGLAAWRAAGLPVESGPAPAATPRHFTATYNPDLFASGDDVARVLADGTAVVADARAADRFYGRVAEPRAGLRGGHMPGAHNVPFTSLVADGRLKSPAEVRDIFQKAGVDLDKTVVTTCGSGVTAAVLSLALETIGKPSAVYDGSWTEWGSDPKRPVTTED
ncbi:3-mercaptopyruvate sulfurtransferase [Acuticoccus mangrovi]|uniref:3-mercaptopyruvate sulfurtransferase n=1 Tax=Acuticoccus mangrovi TaxID=2796142 RepID=A0A934IU64_9HYPH|nr:3-mercaptopyruvate sulfurtransferase [Acuticoccus mangrovi]MBJ3778237.1 3-mercaptopyruvate sulfurtransferase [Acuticoccus mangrovi]